MSFRTPQPEQVYIVDLVAGNRGIIGNTGNYPGRNPAYPPISPLTVIYFAVTAEPDITGKIRFLDLPGIARMQPAIADFFLPAIYELLVKHTVLVANTIANGRYLQRGERVQITGCQPSQTAITQTRFLFMIDDLLQVQADFSCCLGKLIIETKVDQVVMQVRAHEKFRRQVTDNLGIFLQQCLHRINKEMLHPVAQGVGYGKVAII